MNTPGIIKYPFWKLTLYNRKSTYACINLTEAYAPTQIASRSICIGANVGSALADLLGDRQLMKAQLKGSYNCISDTTRTWRLVVRSGLGLGRKLSCPSSNFPSFL